MFGKADNHEPALIYEEVSVKPLNLIALKALMGNSRRSLHVVLAVAFSVALIFSSFAVTDSFVGRITQLSEGYTVTDTFHILESESSFSKSKINSGILTELPDDIIVSPVIQSKVTVTQETVLNLWGMDIQGFKDIHGTRISGEPPTRLYEVLAGASLSEKNNIETGNIIPIIIDKESVNLFVTGTFRSSTQYDDGLVASHETALVFRPEMHDSFSYLEVKTQDATTFLENYDAPDTSLIPSHALQDYLRAVSVEVRNDLLVVSLVISFLTLVTVSHTMYKIVSDSMSELVILRSIGVTKNGVITLIVLNSVILSISGALIGLIFGNVITNAASVSIFIVLKSIYLPVSFDSTLYMYCVLLSTVVGVLGGYASVVFRRPNREIFGVVRTI